MNSSFYFLQFASLTFGLIFAIKIINFKRSAWIFYFLATLAGSFQFINLSNFQITEYLSSLPMYSHDLLLSLVAILIYNYIKVKPKKINTKNILLVCCLIILTTILMLAFDYLTIPTDVLFDNNIYNYIGLIFGISVYIGAALLAFGYVSGLLINAIYSIQLVTINIFLMLKFDVYPLHGFISMFFNILTLYVFLYGYKKNKKLLSH
ncbi:hypothetical protein [Francisella adeliensis]|uniref:Nicotinamide riboside transporter PnuC n=1 Tax=Francisella adeliensis TaxID=2007306 RepID=A0A2Z4XXS5_9GAMM|nr:hypothetical protein [Francisella adeliensis]AXA33624.1 hypothetical protein CDH04_04010 [Francisella adeliensis]MBK2085131.1 hypothetical protein [Francisella adeliensis]MBK2097392.1 hypothetical protein [Francisella adeliensis]QIW11858.1 hypothetical protein FZC43_04010 [Francisella adeliensis]QIW13734.1 hypothetical protein FZC44_04010 [Francisella adeliensis]